MRNGEDGEPIDLGAVTRVHRRRREKKLMTMEEVNERFPLSKYKAWMTTRAEEGLPTAGGIAAAAPSRAASIKDEAGVTGSEEKRSMSPEATTSNIRPTRTSTDTEDIIPATDEHGSPEITTTDSSIPSEASAAPEIATSPARPSTAKSGNPLTTKPTNATSEADAEAEGDGDDDDDQIHAAIPTAQLPDPGDACAICLDTIEEDDDIRGLTCGHAFHASCVDPWLTSRRACCPLCKADYYVPKPRPDGAAAEDLTRPAPPQYAFMGAHQFHVHGRRPTMVIPGRFMTILYNDDERYAFPPVGRAPRPSRPGRAARREARRASSAALVNTEEPNAAAGGPAGDEQAENHAQSGWRSRLGSIRIPAPQGWARPRNASAPNPSGPAAEPSITEPSPAQLEAGRS
jgi:hypothetical protein